MEKYIPELLGERKSVKTEFKSIEEGMQFVMDYVSNNNEKIGIVLQNMLEAQGKSKAHSTTFLLYLCNHLESVYSIKINFKDLMKAADKYVDENWETLKTEATKLREAEKQIDEVFKKGPDHADSNEAT